ncbi:RNA polymerase-associated protein CTR9-like protein [Smittium culicis]|uniref:RNA polymerase-associated protein CTR9-like protein n=1 Tax=Smittium culicis TaxID=133412 RepID=A0A1R1Y165_9FUNG|nr:RNA polymerase-associated protein CTR9-like protein [Smittium culicis]
MLSPQARVIEIPLDGSENVLEIDCSQLPESSFDICEVLDQEKSHIKFYLIFALEYYRQGKLDEAILLLKRGLSKDTLSDVLIKLPLINCLANIYIQKGKYLFVHDSSRKSSLKNSSEIDSLYDSFNSTQADIKSGRDAFFQLAAALFKEADRISPDNLTTLLGKAILHLANNLFDLAYPLFSAVLSKDPRSIPALLGIAKVQYSKHLYSASLSSFQSILKISPNSTPDPRLGMALCFSKLGNTHLAKLCLQRSIQMNSENISAKILLSTILFNEAKDILTNNPSSIIQDTSINENLTDIINHSMSLLKDSYKCDPLNPSLLLLLAERFFLQKKYNLSESFSKKAFLLTDSPVIQSVAQYYIARIYHSSSNFSRAIELYQKSLSLHPSNPLSRFGLGKIQIYNSEMAAAVSTFQNLLTRFSSCIEVIDSLAYLHSKLSNQKAQAIEYYELEINAILNNGRPNFTGSSFDNLDMFSDPFLFLQCASLSESISISKAKSYYISAKSILNSLYKDDKLKSSLSKKYSLSEISNNIGVLHLLLNENELGLKELQSALHSLSDSAISTHGSAADENINQASGPLSPTNSSQLPNLSDPTIKYNLARANETLGEYEKAKELYTQILDSYPNYIDAILRLAMISFQIEQNIDLAQKYVDNALKIESSNVNSLLVQSELQFAKLDMKSGKKTLENILKNVDRHDLYSLCSLGNFYLKSVRSDSHSIILLKQSMNHLSSPHSSKTAPGQAVNEKGNLDALQSQYKSRINSLITYYKRACDFFRKCLALNPKFVAAASGFGSIMAETGAFSEAKDLFLEIREAQASYSMDSGLIGFSGNNDNSLSLNPSSNSGLPSTNNPLPNNVSTSSNSLVDSLSPSNLGFELPMILSGGPLEDSLLSVASNLAHIYNELGQYRSASNLYESCIKRAQLLTSNTKSNRTNYGNILFSRNLQLCYAKTLYTQARVNKSIPTMQQALSNLNHLCNESIRLESSKSDDSLSKSGFNKSDHVSNDSINATQIINKSDSDLNSNTDNATTRLDDKHTSKDGANTASSNITSKIVANIDYIQSDPPSEIPLLSVSNIDKATVLVDGCDPTLLYNLALAKQNLAQMVSDLSIEQCTLEELESVLSGLKESNLVFVKLSKCKASLSKLATSLKSGPKSGNLKIETDDSKNSTARDPSRSSKEKVPSFLKFSIDSSMALYRANFGNFLFNSLESKIKKYTDQEEQKKLQAEASRKRRLESKKLLEEQNLAKLEEQRAKDEAILTETQIKNDRLRAEMSNADAAAAYYDEHSNSDGNGAYKNHSLAGSGIDNDQGSKSNRLKKSVKKPRLEGRKLSNKLRKKTISNNQPDSYNADSFNHDSDFGNSNPEFDNKIEYSSDDIEPKNQYSNNEDNAFKKRRKDLLNIRRARRENNLSSEKRKIRYSSTNDFSNSDAGFKSNASNSDESKSIKPRKTVKRIQNKKRRNNISSDDKSSGDDLSSHYDFENAESKRLSKDFNSFEEDSRKSKNSQIKRNRDNTDDSSALKRSKKNKYFADESAKSNSKSLHETKTHSISNSKSKSTKSLSKTFKPSKVNSDEPGLATNNPDYSENDLFGIDSELSSGLSSDLASDLSDF